jgi:hypothetical protein
LETQLLTDLRNGTLSADLSPELSIRGLKRIEFPTDTEQIASSTNAHGKWCCTPSKQEPGLTSGKWQLSSRVDFKSSERIIETSLLPIKYIQTYKSRSRRIKVSPQVMECLLKIILKHQAREQLLLFTATPTTAFSSWHSWPFQGQ